MSNEHESTPTAVTAVTAARFDRNGDTVFNLARRVTASPGAAWHATVAAFSAVTERVPANAPAGTDDRDLLLMGCWHARGLLSQTAASPEYAAQLRAHDEAAAAAAPPQPPVVAANDALPVDQREVLALRGLADLDHAELAVLLRADPGLLAAMLAQSRLMLGDALRGSQIAQAALTDPDDRHALALAALREDDQLRAPEARERLDSWLRADEGNRAVVEAMDEAASAYRAWTPGPAPAGLREAVIAASAQVTPAAPVAAPAAPATPQAPAAAAPSSAAPPAAAAAPAAPSPAADEPTQVRPAAAAPSPAADPGATVEWSSSEVAALGLEGAPRGRDEAPAAPSGGGPEWEDWDDDAAAGEPTGGDLLQPLDRDRARAPRWQIALVGILLVAVVVALVLMLTKKDDPTPATPSTGKSTSTRERTSTRKRTGTERGALPGGPIVATLRLPNATVHVRG